MFTKKKKSYVTQKDDALSVRKKCYISVVDKASHKVTEMFSVTSGSVTTWQIVKFLRIVSILTNMNKSPVLFLIFDSVPKKKKKKKIIYTVYIYTQC